jgi:hypothetical protein
MARVGSVVLGVGLVVLWIVGMNHFATAWLTWMDGMAGLISFVIAALIPGETGRSSAGAPSVVGVGLVALWLVALGTDATNWLAWWTLGFGCAYLLVSIASVAPPLRQLRDRTA